MATNKKPRKKYTPKPKYDDNAIILSRMRIFFEALYKFFTDLKSGKCAVWKFDDVGYAPYVKLGDQIYAAFVFLQIFSDFAEKVFSYKNIKLDFAPLRDFAGYLCEKTEEVLKGLLHSRNWYVRYNASQSLDKLGVEYTDLIDVFEGEDRYAGEIMRYRLDQKKMKEREVKV